MLTTESRHPYYVYPSYAAKLMVERCDQLWLSDITYMRRGEAFLYLIVVLDAPSRRVIGWSLGEANDWRRNMHFPVPLTGRGSR